MCRPKPDNQLTLGGVARPELLGPVGTHVAGAVEGGDAPHLVGVRVDEELANIGGISITNGDALAILAALAFFFVANYSMCYLSLIILRWREPDLPRPYRSWGYPWTTLLVLLGSVAFLIGAIIGDRKNSLVALAILAGSYPLYLIVKLLRPRASS